MKKSIIFLWVGFASFLLAVAYSYQTKGMELYFLISKLCLNYFLLFSTQVKNIKNKIVPIMPTTKSIRPVIKLINFYFGFGLNTSIISE